MARQKRKRTVKKKGFLKDNVRHEVIGIIVLGLAILGMVAIYSGSNGLIGNKIKVGLTLIAGNGRFWLLLMLGAWGIAYMNRKHIDNLWRTVGVVLLWLAFEGLLHFQLPGIDTLSRDYLLAEGKLGHGGGLVDYRCFIGYESVSYWRVTASPKG